MQNRKKTDTDTEKDEDDDDDQVMPETTGRPIYDTSERNSRHASVQADMEDDSIHIHSDGEISRDNTETTIRRSNRNVNKLSRYGSIPYTGCFGG